MCIPDSQWILFSDITWTLPNTDVPHKIHQQQTVHRDNKFQPQKSHQTRHHTCWQSDGSNSRLRQINKILGQCQRIRRNKPADSYHIVRDATQNIYCRKKYDNNKRASKIKGASINQEQQHTRKEINGPIKYSITHIGHAISSEGVTVNKSQT